MTATISFYDVGGKLMQLEPQTTGIDFGKFLVIVNRLQSWQYEIEEWI